MFKFFYSFGTPLPGINLRLYEYTYNIFETLYVWKDIMSEVTADDVDTNFPDTDSR